MQAFFEYLNSKGLTQKKYANKLYSLTPAELMDLIANGVGLASVDRTLDKNSNFNFVANDTLSGGMFPCTELPCRLSNIDTLARNAILYADTVFISNPFEKYTHIDEFTDYTRFQLGVDLTLLYHVKPLLDENIFQLSSSFMHVCKACLRKMKVLTKAYEKKMDKAQKELFDICLTKLNYRFTTEPNSRTAVDISGQKDILPHGMTIWWEEPSEEITKTIGSKKKGKLTKEQVIKLGLVDSLVYPIIEDLITQNYYSNFFNSYYLTHRNIDARIINNNHTKAKSGYNEIIKNSLDHNLPFVPNIDLKKMIQLRKKEGEAFQIYRASLTNFLTSIKSPDYHLKEAFRDEIQPEINKIKQTIKTSRKLILSDMTKDLVIGSTYVSIGLFSHLLPPTIGEITAALGGKNYLDRFGDNVKKLTTLKSEVKTNKYYFIWRLQKLK